MKKLALPILFIFLFASAFQFNQPLKQPTAPPSIINDSVKKRIDATLKSFVESEKLVGVSALVFEKGKEVYYNAFGYADREANKPMDRNTIVRIYSMTKPITGVALMKLYEKGSFQLDDPLSKYAPEFTNMKVFKGVDASGKMILEPVKRPITVRDITRHTAGFAQQNHPVLGDLVRKANAMDVNNTLSEMAKKLASLPLQFHPGDEWSYGVSVDVQAYLVEKISGKPFDQFLKEIIFEPLKMTHTKYVLSQDEMKNFSAGYRRNNDGKLNRIADSEANNFNTKEWALKPGGFGLVSTLDDYMKFAQMLVNKGSLGNTTILKPETVKLMATSHLSDTVSQRMWLPSKGRVGFGIDFAVRTAPAQTAEENVGTVGEFFWDGAASTLFWVDPVNELTAVLFTQVMPFYGELHKRFRDAVYGPYDPKLSAKQ
jgi:CubicO group peptidase (beta-lactamase class C family)